ncbi:AI-2E family transporter, partial [Clostridium perfringens]|nr:AI-2E family transporter [Clostridium perfringens]
IPIVTYYFLVDGDLIYNKLLLILPTEKRIITKKLISHIDKVLARYIISQFLLSGIIGVLTFAVLMIIGVKFALILGIFNGVLNIIPYFGPIIGGVPAIFVALMESPNKALWTLIAVFIIQQIEGNILSPKITGDSTNMHPIIIIILLLV